MAAQNLTRREMITIMEKYTEAVIQKKPELLPLAENVRALYSADRPLTAAPRIPEPYDTFANTFSYGKAVD